MQITSMNTVTNTSQMDPIFQPQQTIYRYILLSSYVIDRPDEGRVDCNVWNFMVRDSSDMQ